MCRHALGRSRKKINDRLPVWLVDLPSLPPQPPEFPSNKGGAAEVTVASQPTPTTAETLAAPPPRDPPRDARPLIDASRLGEISKELETALAATPVKIEAIDGALGELEGVRVTRSLLGASGAGKVVNGVAKAKCDASARARALVDAWRAAVEAEKAAAAAAGGRGGASAAAADVRHPSASLLAECHAPTDWKALKASLTIDRTVTEVDWITPGSAASLRAVRSFCAKRLALFAEKRNDPNVHACSDLSPYLHFGQLSAQRMALIAKEAAAEQGSAAAQAGLDSFLEESIVRRELSDNFCLYNPRYDSLDGAAGWARQSLEVHSADRRERVYSLEQLEAGKSHEDIWNAAQLQMVRTGKMHGFMRMYWAKKILEWSPTPAEALRRAIYLNDKYELDGRDPNGYVGCGWAIMGVHDMGWKEREIFGKIRFMNYDGCKRKFDIKRYAATWAHSRPSTLAPPAKKARAD